MCAESKIPIYYIPYVNRTKVSKISYLFSVIALALSFLASGCAEKKSTLPDYQSHVSRALEKIGLRLSDLSLPKLGRPYSTPGRQQAVDKAMGEPLWVLGTGKRLSELYKYQDSLPLYQMMLLNILGYSDLQLSAINKTYSDNNEIIIKLDKTKLDAAGKKQLYRLLMQLVDAAQNYLDMYLAADATTREAITTHLRQLIGDTSQDVENRRLSLAEYHEIGKSYQVKQQASLLLNCLAAIESYIESTDLQIEKSVTFNTSLGKVRIAGKGDDTHTGHYFLLIDLGGDDIYHDVGSVPPQPNFTFVIDHSGNDKVTWQYATGPGAGIFGIGVWTDLRGNDIYQGRNAGIGVGLFGAGALWDKEGDDRYLSGSLSQGAAQYGIGILIDEGGNDRFEAEISSQGYGGTGGVGLVVNYRGDDHYQCGGSMPDQSKARALRHSKTHYVSMCQGYGFGRRPEISGGIGLLLDHAGNDTYEGDLFVQGGAYWFGLGMLIDSAGDDIYTAFEHAQGESLHLGAGFLGDYNGNDRYISHEHSQGTGIDRAIGILMDENGDDSYKAVRESQGAGIKPYGTGLLIDSSGSDTYVSTSSSQGYSKTLNKKFPASQWPLGMLLDLGGGDEFVLPYGETVSKQGRIQNRQGIAVDY